MTELGAVRNIPVGAEGLVRWPTQPTLTAVAFATGELLAVCPVTGQPDLYRADFSWEPTGWTIESKSLKFYLWGFRDRPISCEDLAHTLATDLSGTVESPVTVVLAQSVRGGLTLTVEAVGDNPAHLAYHLPAQ